MKRDLAIVAGSFDPMTLGHRDLIEAAAKRYGQVVVAVMVNDAKQTLFDMETRVRIAEATVAGALHVRLGGYNSYFGQQHFRAYMGEQIETLGIKHIMGSIRLMYTATVLFIIVCYAMFGL